MPARRHKHSSLNRQKHAGRKHGFLHRHSLGLAAVAILLLWLVLYIGSRPDTRSGAFFGNAVADWAGVVVTVFATKYLYERGSAESRQPVSRPRTLASRLIHEHSLSIFVVITGLGWLWLYLRVDPSSRWGQVVGNVLSEWTQILGLILMTKRLVELHSKENRR